MKALPGLAVLLCCGYLVWHNFAPTPKGYTPPVAAYNPPAEVPRTFHGFTCTDDCSGHEAGYNWAENKDIDDSDDCDAAGDTHNSPSFAEGCRAYVSENDLSYDESDDDTYQGP